MIKYIDVIIIGLFLFLTIGYNVFSEENGNGLNKGIYYDNFKYTDNVSLDEVDGTNINFSGKLEIPGDFYELSFDVINSTNTDVEIEDFFYHKSDEFISYQLTYKDGTKIKNGDILKAGQTRGVYYKVAYNNPITESDYTFDASFNINYEQVI